MTMDASAVDNLAAPLATLLVDAAFGPVRRWLPGASTARPRSRPSAKSTLARPIPEYGERRYAYSEERPAPAHANEP